MDASLRDLVRRRAGDRCEYCRLSQEHAPVVRFWIEHIVAKQHGGDDAPSNLALACPHCNRCKGPNLTAIDPQSGGIVPLFNPRTDSWHEHCALQGVQIVGLTPTGRATVRLLKMNSEDRLEIRRHLEARGELVLFDEG